jgi:hypothetical protein
MELGFSIPDPRTLPFFQYSSPFQKINNYGTLLSTGQWQFCPLKIKFEPVS